MIKIRFIDLFAGIGGFRLGLERSGHQCVWSNEIDKYANQIYKKQFGGDNHDARDIRKIKASELPEFDLLCGGFPCQAFSIAGKRKGFTDTRGTLFFEIARILKAKRPSYCLLENVKGLLNHNKGETFRVIIQTLSELGYDVQWLVLNSKFHGVPQNRERVFIVGNLRDKPRPEILPFRESNEINSEEQKEQIARTITSQYYKQGQWEQYIVSAFLTPDRKSKRQNGRRQKEPNEPMFTLTGQDIHGVMITSHSPRTNDPKLGGSDPLESTEHYFTIDSSPHILNRLRRLTPLECELLQSFPKGYTEFGIETFINPEIHYSDYGEKEKTNTIKILQVLWETIDKETRERWGLTEFITFFKNEILQQRMYEKGLQMQMEEKQSASMGLQLSSKTNSYFFRMREMWLEEKHRYTPQRQTKIEQLFEKLTSSMQKLPQQSSSERIVKISDTQRYKCLGNAVTVNVIEVIGKRLVG